VDAHIWVLEADGHSGEVFLRETDDGFVDVTEDCRFDGRVFDNFAEDAAVAAADDEDFFGVGVGVHGEVGYHFLVAGGVVSVSYFRVERLNWVQCGDGEWNGSAECRAKQMSKGDAENVRELISFGALDHVIQHKNGTMVGRFEDQNILVFGLFVVEDFLDFEDHGLTGPHLGDLAEPAI
jgi:hypothetical protein